MEKAGKRGGARKRTENANENAKRNRHKQNRKGKKDTLENGSTGNKHHGRVDHLQRRMTSGGAAGALARERSGAAQGHPKLLTLESLRWPPPHLAS